MRIEYRILWVEDNKSWYETTKDLFKELMDDLGFKLIPKNCRSFDEVKNEIEANNLKEYDLLLVDFSLAGSPNGDEIIKLIRGNEDNPILTDVLFYSTAVEEVRSSMQRLGLEGVYTADRKDIETKFELVVNTTIKKIQEVNPMRGLIMAETSDLDDLMLIIIQKVLTSDLGQAFEEYIKKEIESSLKNISKKTLDTEISINDKIQDSRIFTSFHRAKCINKLYKEKNVGIEKFFDSYNTDVLSTRNTFAHVKESIENGKKVLISHVTGKKEVFNEERCIEIRQTLIKYRDILEKINTELNTNS